MDPRVQDVFSNFSKPAQTKLLEIRELIHQVADDIGQRETLLETLKWGEPSYLVKGGSTVRLGWKKANPDQCAVYFICSTNLVETFRMMYEDQLDLEGDRAILLDLKEPLPRKELQKCITLAMTYHKVKHLPFLGA